MPIGGSSSQNQNGTQNPENLQNLENQLNRNPRNPLNFLNLRNQENRSETATVPERIIIVQKERMLAGDPR